MGQRLNKFFHFNEHFGSCGVVGCHGDGYHYGNCSYVISIPVSVVLLGICQSSDAYYCKTANISVQETLAKLA